jgi:hypothetical protein
MVQQLYPQRNRPRVLIRPYPPPTPETPQQAQPGGHPATVDRLVDQ